MFGSLKELKKRGKKSSGYPGLWPWLGSWWLSLGEGFGKRKPADGGRKKHENQICLGNRWWIEWLTPDVGVNTTEKEKNQVNLWWSSYLLHHQGLCERLIHNKKMWGKTLDWSTCSLRRGWEQNMWQILVMSFRKVFKYHDEWWVWYKDL